LCGIGVTSRDHHDVESRGGQRRARRTRVRTRGPFTRTSTLFIPYWVAPPTPAAASGRPAARRTACPCANPLKPIAPAEDQHTTRPSVVCDGDLRVVERRGRRRPLRGGMMRRSRLLLEFLFLRFAAAAGFSRCYCRVRRCILFAALLPRFTPFSFDAESEKTRQAGAQHAAPLHANLLTLLTENLLLRPPPRRAADPCGVAAALVCVRWPRTGRFPAVAGFPR